ncbi:MAG TPA: hypothetical protein VMT94_07485 [Burkholderiales bacterium]|nr:hypothetical protein [Burkholderiales bacterium]
MLLLRILGFLLLITIGGGIVMFVVTRDRRYLTFTRQALKYGILIAIVVLAFMVLERVVLVV